jgi:hypothetical protein
VAPGLGYSPSLEWSLNPDLEPPMTKVQRKLEVPIKSLVPDGSGYIEIFTVHCTPTEAAEYFSQSTNQLKPILSLITTSDEVDHRQQMI